MAKTGPTRSRRGPLPAGETVPRPPARAERSVEELADLLLRRREEARARRGRPSRSRPEDGAAERRAAARAVSGRGPLTSPHHLATLHSIFAAVTPEDHDGDPRARDRRRT
ncbi:hypothetical protein ACFFMN_20685 [Planobispora siamensis]|uniref:Uncharacterized protein n=1 Tax=Planobispora siamensis TaxID=936338 RepID=A0A8J3SFC2_9ACTN|nr:hypothetical protein [Planobispora siamensis]GIH93551.1 hypothetical protein Psi01_41810 [Planobispora siamensis]